MKEFIIFLRYFFGLAMLARHVLIALLVLMAIGAGFISIAEGMNYWEALYFALITGLTVGYGDVAPTTVLGRIVSVLIGLIGMVFFGIVIAAANRALATRVRERRAKERSGDR